MATGGYRVHDKKSKPLVVAIDIGTDSSYAFSWKDDYNNDPCHVSVNPNWVAGSMSLMSMKAPSCLLFDKDQQFHSFGYDAEDAYSELVLDGKHDQWYFFRLVKMRLHETSMHRDTKIEDDKGRKMPAMVVFSAAIQYLKKHLFDLLETRGIQITEDDVHFVLIWTYSSKQFMREAADLAGIDGGQLSIVLQSEAACHFCRLIPTQKMMGSEGAKVAVASPGTKYMVIDLGDGTADITVLETEPDGRLKEVHKAIEGAWGITKVDEEFNELLIAIVGAPVFQRFCDENKSDQLDLQRELEARKRTIIPSMQGKITVKVPVAILQTYEEEMGEKIKEAIENSPYAGKISWLNDKLRIDADLFKSLFKPCTDEIVSHIKDLLQNPKVQGTNIFLMVGGFSESPIVQETIMKALREVLPHGKVIIPEDAEFAALKGAVIFGHRPISVTHRVSKYTYGISISPLFDANKHPDDHKVSVDNVDRCRDVFERYIQEGDTIQVGEAKLGKHITLKPNQKEMLLKIFASPKHDPMFVDEDDCEMLGNVIVNLPDSEERIRVEVRMMFGETELAVEAEELAHHSKTRAYFDLL